MEDLSLFVVSHVKLNKDKYVDRHIIYVGKNADKFKEDGDFADNTLDNIANKNYTYCECTAIYWLWKNYHDCEYIGIEHYRRLFGYVSYPFLIPYRKQWFLKQLKKYDCVVFAPFIFIRNIDQWNITYDTIYIKELENAVKKLYPNYLATFLECFYARSGCFCNMIVTKKKIYDEYCKFLFDILFETEKHIEISTEPYQRRMMGFLAERLMYVFLIFNKYKLKKVMISSNKTGYQERKKRNGAKRTKNFFKRNIQRKNNKRIQG